MMGRVGYICKGWEKGKKKEGEWSKGCVEPCGLAGWLAGRYSGGDGGLVVVAGWWVNAVVCAVLWLCLWLCVCV